MTKKVKDITETGPKALKGIRNPDLYRTKNNPLDASISDMEMQSLQNTAGSAVHRNYNTAHGHIGYEGLSDESLYNPQVTNIDYGSSMFDKGLIYDPTQEDVQNIRAENQPWYAQIGAGLAKGAVLAGTTFLDGTIGMILGAGTAIGEGRWSGLWDNAFSRAMKATNDAFERDMPNYYSSEEMNTPWYDNIFTANFLGDKFIKNLGFSVGALYSGGVTAAGLKVTKLPQLIGAITKSSMAPALVTSTVGAVTSAVNEGRIEALNNSKDWFDLQKRKLDDEFAIRIQALQDRYETTKGTLTRTRDGQMIDTAYADLQEALQKEKEAYNAALGKLSEDRLKMGNMDLLFNIPILTASNFIQFSKMYANGFRTARRTANIVGRAGDYTAGTTKLGATVAITKGALSEGTEEISQKAASAIAGKYYETDVNNFYKSKTDRKASQETLSWAKAFAEGINETVNDASSWEEFAIGALTGFMGIPKFRSMKNTEGKWQSPIAIEGGAYNSWREYQEKIQREQEIASRMNERFNSPEFRNYYQGLIRHNKYQGDMNRAAEENNEFDFKNAEHAQLVSDIIMFDNAGRLEDLTTLIDAAFDTSDENLASIVENTTTTLEDGSRVGPFVDKNGNPMYATPEGKQEMIDKLQQNHDEMTNTINNYLKIKDELDIRTGQQLSDDQLEELTWMKSQLGNWSERATAMSGEVKSAIGNVIGNLSSLLNFNQQVRDYEGQHSADLTDRYRQADENIKTIEGVIRTLNFVRSQNDVALTNVLATDPEFVEGLIKEINEVDDTVLSADEKEDITTKLNDIVKLGNASKTYNAKLKEYLKNPQKQAEDHAKADEQAAQQETTTNTNNIKTSLNAATNLSEFRKVVDDNIDDIENLNDILDELENEGSEMAKNYRETSQYNNEVRRVLNESDAEPQVKQDAMKLLQDQFNNSENLEQLANPNSIYINNENAFDDSSEGDVELSASRFQEAQYALQNAMSQVNNDNKFKDRFSPEYKKPVGKREGTVRGDDRTTTGDSGTSTTPTVTSSEDLPTTELPVGNVTAEMVNEENKKANERVETPQRPSRDKTNKFYRPAIPELHIEASKEGDFRPFDVVVSEREQGVDFSAIYNYLRDKGAFRYLNEGQLKVGDEIGFMIDPSFNDHTIFIIDKKNGQVIGSLDESDYSISRYEGLKSLIDRVKHEYTQRNTLPQQRQFKTDYQYDKEMSFYGGQIHGTLDRVENGTAIYVDSKGQPTILLAGKSDHQFIGIFREPNSNRWSIKMENKEGDKSIFRDMMSSVMAQLPLGAEIYERTPVSVDGLRVFAQQLNHGFEVGNETYETDINGGDIANIFGLSKADQKAMEKVHISEQELPKVKEILKPYLEKFGVKNIDKVIYLTNGNTLSVKLPVLVKTKQATSTQSIGGTSQVSTTNSNAKTHTYETVGGHKVTVNTTTVHLDELKEGDKIFYPGSPTDPPVTVKGRKEGRIIIDDGSGQLSFIGQQSGTNWSEVLKDSPYVERIISDTKEEAASKPQSKGKFIASPTTRVSKIMAGRVPYGNIERSLSEIPNVSSESHKPVFGIIKNGVLTTNGKIDDSLIIKPVDMSQKEGRLYLLIPNGAGKYSPAAVRVKHFNNEEFNLNDSSVSSSPVGEDIKNAITKLSTATSQDDVSAAMQDLAQDLYMQDIMVTWFSSRAGDGIVISKKVRKPDGTYEKVIINGKEQIKEDKYDVYFSTSSKSAEIGGINFDATALEQLGNTSALGVPKDPNDIYNEILRHLIKFNLPLQVSTRRINEGAYNNRLINSNILTSNITEASVRSTWFTTDYFDNEGNLHQAISPASVTPQPKRKVETPVGGTEGAIAGTRIMSVFSNKPYYVDLKTNTIRDGQGRTVEVTDSNRILFDLAWAQDNFGDSTNSSMMVNNKVLTPDGKVLDRSKQIYLSGQEAQDVKDAIAGRKKEREDRVAKSREVVSEIYENQKRVDKTRTDGEFYYVLEDDGEYHQYSRVHSRLGSNWIESDKQTKALELARFNLSKFVDNPTQYENYLKYLEKKFKVDLTAYRGKTDAKSRDTIVNIVRDKMSGTNSQRALDAGSAVDSIIRQYFTIRDVSKIVKPSNMSENAFIDLITTLNRVKSNMEQMGERFLADNIVLFQKYPDGTRVAGEVDILSIDKDGNFRIYDVKTSRYSFYDFTDRYGYKVNYFTTPSATQRMSAKDYYTLQLSAYKNLFESQYGVPVTKLAVMPFVLSYDKENVSSVQSEKGIPIAYNPAVNVPLVSAVKVDKSTETPATPAQAQTVLPIFETSLETQNPIEDLTPEHKSSDKDKVGYFELDGKLHKGYITPLTVIDGVEVHVTKVPNITKGFGRQGEAAHVASNSFYAVFPNGKTFLFLKNNPVQGGVTQSQVEDAIKKGLEANPQKVKELASEKTILFDPDAVPTVSAAPVTTVETPATINQGSTQTGAAYTAQKEQAINDHDEEFEDEFTLRRAEGTTISTIWNQEKELEWLNKVLPQLSEQDRVKVVKGLIKVGKRGTLAWGQFDKGIITLSDIAAEGTTYHEAFHAVFNLLLDNNERQALYDEAKKLYGEKDNLSLEEDMAEGFRRYVMTRQNRGLGKRILDFFKELFTKVTNWNNIRPSLINYYRRINEGKYADSIFKVPTISELRGATSTTTSFNTLSDSMQENLLKKGWTAEKFDSVSQEERDQAVKCIAF